jgi:hypothetical protein
MTLLGIGAYLEEGSRPGRGGWPALGICLNLLLARRWFMGRGIDAEQLLRSSRKVR